MVETGNLCEEVVKMENSPMRLNAVGIQQYTDCISEMKSRFWQIENQPIPRSEVICPLPRRATRVPHFMDSLNRISGKPKGILPMYRVDCASEILDLILNKDDPEGDLEFNNQSGFFCGSPPVRTNNPVIHDQQFVKQTQSLSSPLATSPGMQAARSERGSPTCGSSFGGSPKVRIEGFSCGSSESHCVVPALA